MTNTSGGITPDLAALQRAVQANARPADHRLRYDCWTVYHLSPVTGRRVEVAVVAGSQNELALRRNDVRANEVIDVPDYTREVREFLDRLETVLHDSDFSTGNIINLKATMTGAIRLSKPISVLARNAAAAAAYAYSITVLKTEPDSMPSADEPRDMRVTTERADGNDEHLVGQSGDQNTGGAEIACLFCQVDDSTANRVLARNDLAYARWDNYPAADGHVEIVPLRHVESFFDLTADEVTSMYSLARTARDHIDSKYRPDGYTIGVNEGSAAGQTIHHVHLHLIPRHFGDVAKPRGGIRAIIDGKGDY